MNAGACRGLGIDPGDVRQQREQTFCIAVIVKLGGKKNAPAVVVQFAVLKPVMNVELTGARQPAAGSHHFTHRGKIASHLEIDVAHAGADLFFRAGMPFCGIADAQSG